MTFSRLSMDKYRHNLTIRTANAMLFSAMEFSFRVIILERTRSNGSHQKPAWLDFRLSRFHADHVPYLEGALLFKPIFMPIL